MDEDRMRSPLSPRWLGLRWSAWMPLVAAHPLALAQLPSHPGLLRIRETHGSRLEWVGWVDAGVRQAAERLSRQVHLPVPPFDDPCVPAQVLWEKRRVKGVSFEVSGAIPEKADPARTQWTDILSVHYPEETPLGP